MKKIIYILCLILSFAPAYVDAQSAVDTLCLSAGPSNFAVPYVPGQSYSWQVTGGQIVTNPDSNDVRVVWDNVPGLQEISVVASTEQGCPGDTSRYFINLRGPEIAQAKGPTQVCSGTLVTFESTAQGNCVWSGGETTPSISFIAEKDTVIRLVVLNEPCANDTMYYFLEVDEAPSAGMNYVEDTVRVDSDANFHYTGTGASGIEWFHNGNSISTRSAVKIEFSTLGQHEILQVVTQGGCSDTLRKSVYVDDVFKVFIPNTFTPNGDGKNDHFTFDGVGIKSFQAEIYNRWGEKIFEWNENTPVPGWDGTNSGRDSKMDAYIYKIRVEDFRGKSHFYQAAVNLLR